MELVITHQLPRVKYTFVDSGSILYLCAKTMAGGSVARRRWTTEEDTTLRQAVLGYDPSNISRSAWTDIAHRVGNERSPKVSDNILKPHRRS